MNKEHKLKTDGISVKPPQSLPETPAPRLAQSNNTFEQWLRGYRERLLKVSLPPRT